MQTLTRSNKENLRYSSWISPVVRSARAKHLSNSCDPCELQNNRRMRAEPTTPAMRINFRLQPGQNKRHISQMANAQVRTPLKPLAEPSWKV